MIRTLPILAALPCLAGCDIGNFLNPGKASRESYEHRASITATEPLAAPITPQPTQVAEIPIPAAVDVPEPVYVAPEPPDPPPECYVGLYMIYDCIEGRVVML